MQLKKRIVTMAVWSALALSGAVLPWTSASAYQTAVQTDPVHPVTEADRSTAKPNEPNGREADQDQRVANGLKTGEMTSGEAARVDRTQANIDQQVHDDRVTNGGKLTAQEHQRVNSEQNKESRQIYDAKHNTNTIAPNQVNDREANQQQRTAQGLRSGQETSGEAARSTARQSNVDQQSHDDRVANGGALNAKQKQQLNRSENRNSRQIYNQKHNAPTHPRPRRKG